MSSTGVGGWLSGSPVSSVVGSGGKGGGAVSTKVASPPLRYVRPVIDFTRPSEWPQRLHARQARGFSKPQEGQG